MPGETTLPSSTAQTCPRLRLGDVPGPGRASGTDLDAARRVHLDRPHFGGGFTGWSGSGSRDVPSSYGSHESIVSLCSPADAHALLVPWQQWCPDLRGQASRRPHQVERNSLSQNASALRVSPRIPWTALPQLCAAHEKIRSPWKDRAVEFGNELDRYGFRRGSRP